MTNLKKIASAGVAAAVFASVSLAFAQDDLDDLLKDLESDLAAEAAPAAAAQEEPAAAEEPAAEEPAAEEPAAEEPAAEEPAAEEPAAEEPAAEEPAAEEPKPVAPVAAVAPAVSATNPDAELLDNLRTTERLRREAYDAQAKREIIAARQSMSDGAYADATRYYGNALKLLNDSAATKALRRECEQGIAEGQYRAALEEERLGRRESAVELMEKAKSMRHPKARRQLEAWSKGEDPNANKTALSDIKHRRNDADYKAQRQKNLRHLKRARQLLS